MATTITTYFPAGEPTLTSRIGSVVALTDMEKVSVSVVCDPDDTPAIILRTSLYAFGGTVELTGVGRLIEEYLRMVGRISCKVRVAIGDASIDFLPLYCEYDLDADFDYGSCFYCSAATSIVHSGSVVSLAHWPDGSDTYRVQVVGLGPDGKTAMAERSFTKAPTSMWVSFSVQEILDSVSNSGETGVALSKVAYFAISYGDIQKIFYLAEDPEFLTFRFRNMFNAPEFVDVVGKVARKTKSDRDLAVCDGRAMQYNRTISRTYEVQTAALTEDQAKEIEQLIASHHVALCTRNAFYDILITDHTCEVDNDDESLASIKFTFRFANSRPTMIYKEMGHLLPSASQIFSAEFTSQFS